MHQGGVDLDWGMINPVEGTQMGNPRLNKDKTLIHVIAALQKKMIMGVQKLPRY